MKTIGNDRAYPSDQGLEETNPNFHDVRNGFSGGGLTKREYFAAMAMQGLVVPAIPGGHNSNQPGEAAMKAEMAVRLADALIQALNGEKS